MQPLSLKVSPATEARMFRVSLRAVSKSVYRAMVMASNRTLQSRIQSTATAEQALTLARVRMLLAEADTLLKKLCNG